MHKPSIAQLVYNATFPRPRPNDPTSFPAHIARHLVPEVRIETSTFYGSLDCIEAQYPGLDYTYKPHRMRLSRFPWHRKLFKVFDELGLTNSEISSLCRWEGTKSARERYEKEEGVKVRDTTADSIPLASPTPPPSIEVHFVDDDAEEDSSSESEIELSGRDILNVATTNGGVGFYPGRDSEEADSSDEEIESYGVELNNRLMAASAAREQGANVPLDNAWEQWFKEMAERRGYSDMMDAIRTGQPFDILSSNPTLSSSTSSSSSSPLRYAATTGLLLTSTSIASLSAPATSAVRERSSHPPGTAR